MEGENEVVSISSFIKSRLAELNISQAELGIRLTLHGCSTSKQTVSHWVLGRNNPPIEDRKFQHALASSLEIDVNEMMIRMGFCPDQTPISPEAQRAVDIIDNLPNEKREMAVKILEAML